MTFIKRDKTNYSAYELHYQEERQVKIENFQQSLVGQILNLIHEGKEKLMDEDYKDLVIMVKDIVDEEFRQTKY